MIDIRDSWRDRGAPVPRPSVGGPFGVMILAVAALVVAAGAGGLAFGLVYLLVKAALLLIGTVT